MRACRRRRGRPRRLRAARPPAALRRLVAAEGQARAGRVVAGGRAPRGGGGDGPALRARRGGRPLATTSTARAATRRCATTGWSPPASRSPQNEVDEVRWVPLAEAAGAAQLRARRASSSAASDGRSSSMSFEHVLVVGAGPDGRRDRPGRRRLGPPRLAPRPLPRRDRAGARDDAAEPRAGSPRRAGPIPTRCSRASSVVDELVAGRPDDRGGRRGRGRQGGHLPPRRRAAARRTRSSPRTRARSRSARSPRSPPGPTG